jgi:hypothetical protein
MTISGTQVLVLGALAVATVVVQYFAKRFSGPPFLVQRWAKDNGFRILRCDPRYYWKGPFTWTVSIGRRHVYYVSVHDSEGRERFAWLRCTDGGLFSGDKTEVIWEGQT